MKFKNPIWVDATKQRVLTLTINEETNRETAMVFDADPSNTYFKALSESFTIKDIDKNTKIDTENRAAAKAAAIAEREAAKVQKKEEVKKLVTNNVTTESIFETKLKVFELAVVKSSKNRTFKANIRKATTILDVFASTILIYSEANKLSELKDLKDIFEVVNI